MRLKVRQCAGTGRRTTPETGSKKIGGGGGFSVICVVLVMGLVFSVIDVLYVMHVVHGQELNQSSKELSQSTTEERTTATKAEAEQAKRTKTQTDIYAGKKEIFDLLTRAQLNVADLDNETIAELPTWEEITALYGPKPVVYGLDTCDAFQKLTHRIGFASTAGTFNSGTNLMAELLIHNCHMPIRMKVLGDWNRGIRWQVPWGKHTPLGDEEFRKTHKVDEDAPEAYQVLPGVTLRDPLTWLKSMCHIPYGAKWLHTQDHCPNFSQTNLTTRVKYSEFWRKHDSILGLWNDYYRAYLEASWPRVMVRIEDLIFHPEETTKAVCECAGGALRNDGSFGYIVNSAKLGKHAHGKVRTGMVDAIIKYGSFKKRYQGYTSPADLEYIRDHVDAELMKLMNYSPIDPLRANSADP